jgi:hypothetical protein
LKTALADPSCYRHGIKARITSTDEKETVMTDSRDSERRSSARRHVLKELDSRIRQASTRRRNDREDRRDNPFVQRLASLGGGTRSIGLGLGRIRPNAGILVVYSGRDDQVAHESNSPFAMALIKYLEELGIEINLPFRKVHDSVLAATHGEQEPYSGAVSI